MDKKAASEGLRNLASSDSKRSKTAQLRDLLADVEGALAAGVTRAAVVDELGKHGLHMSLATFDSALRRIRSSQAPKRAARPRKGSSSPGVISPESAAQVQPGAVSSEVPAGESSVPLPLKSPPPVSSSTEPPRSSKGRLSLDDIKRTLATDIDLDNPTI